MKRFFTLVLLNLIFNFIYSQNFNWAKREGLWAYDYGYGIAPDNVGNVYVAGKYELAADFSGTILPCPPPDCNHDIYVAKYTASGALAWINTAGGTLGDYAHDLACDGNNVYVAGEIEGVNAPITFRGSSITITCKAENDAFIAKYDVNGTLLWAQSAGWYQNDKALAVTYDNSGNVYLAGFFNDTALFGTSTMIYGFGGSGNDIYLAKYDKDGNMLWVKKAGGPGRDEAKSVKCDAAGNVYICGLFQGTADFSGQHITSPGTPGAFFDSFLAKYDANGNIQWVKQAGGDWDDVGWSMAIDNQNRIYVTGEFNGNASFDAITLYSTSNMADAFITCYDNAGNVQWAKQAGGNLLDRARGIGTDGNDIFITGQFGTLSGGSASFGSTNLVAADSSDIFIAALDNTGNFLWATSVTGSADTVEALGYESGIAVCASNNGNVFATGSLLNGGTFGTTSYQKYGRTDAFVTNITQPNTHVTPRSDPKYIKVYPNPGNGSFTLSTNRLGKQKFEIIIQNSLGQLLQKRSGNTSDELNIDMSAQEKGIYFIEMRTEDQKIYREKIILE